MGGGKLLPAVWRSIHSTKVREQLPKASNNVTRECRDKGRARLQAMLQSVQLVARLAPGVIGEFAEAFQGISEEHNRLRRHAISVLV